jgi:hypothetical protein
MNIQEQYIILDIECWCPKGTPDPEVDEVRYVGFKYKDKKTILHISEKQKIQEILYFADYIVGHSIKKYDLVVLARYGIKPRYEQVIIDTYEIADNRLKSMLYMDLSQGDRSLKRLLEIFKLSVRKGEFDYSLLKQEYLQDQQLLDLETYLFGDLDGSDELFKFFYEFFYGFKELMPKKDQEKFCWLINKPGSTAMKIICNKLNIKEEYDDSAIEKAKAYDGAFVSEPYCDNIE